MVEVDKELLSDMHWNRKMSMRDIARELGMTKGQVEYLFNCYNIDTRTQAEAQQVIATRTREMKQDIAKEEVAKIVSKAKVPVTNFEPMPRKNLLIPVPFTSDRECSVAIVLSDLHIGDANHTPSTYWSTIANLETVLRNIVSLYKVKSVKMVLNGDMVAGRDVYKFQELRNLIQRGHWQVFLAEIIMKDTIDKLSKICPIDTLYFIKGTHENLATNFILFLKRLLKGRTKYLSNGGVINIAEGIGDYNVLFTHGYGFSDTSPVSSSLIKDVLKTVLDNKTRGINIERVCSSHSHWISSGLVIDNIYWDVTGGFQKWEYTLGQRPAGGIVYLYNNGECVSIPVRPDPQVESSERSDPGLEYRNLVYYGNYLLKHLKDIEEVDNS